MNAQTKNILHVSVITITVAIVMVIARQGFAWTNPAGAPPFASAIISTLGNNVGVGTTNPSAKLEVFAPTLGSSVDNVVEVQRLNSSNGNNNYLDVRNMRTAAGTDWNTAGTRIQEKVDSTWMGYIQFNGDSNNGGISFGTGLTTTPPGDVPERLRINSAGNMSIGTASPDANYKITTANGGIKADANTGQAAGYFNNIGGGPAIIAGTGGITLGGVNQTAWPSSGLGGSGTANYIPKWSAGSTLGNSLIYDNGTSVGVGTPSPSTKLAVSGAISATGITGYNSFGIGMAMGGDGTNGLLYARNNGSWAPAYIDSAALYLNSQSGGNVGIGTASPGYKLDVAGTIHTTNDIVADGNYGLGLVGLYNPTRYRNVYSMGTSYRLAADGTGPGNLYGIANAYEPDYGGAGNNAQSKAGLGHQYLFMANGATQTSIGTGIWTNGNITSSGVAIINGGSSSNWASVNAPTFNALSSIYSYGAICSGNSSGGCGSTGGTVIGTANAGAANNIPNTGITFFNNGSNVGIGTTNPTDKLEINGNLRFTGANPYINAASYFIAPGGAYFNSGAVYTEAAIQARGGIHDDVHTNLTISGGTSGSVTFTGNVGIGTAASAYKLDVAGGIKATSFTGDGSNLTGVLRETARWCDPTTPCSANIYGSSPYCFGYYIGSAGNPGILSINNPDDTNAYAQFRCTTRHGAQTTFWLYYFQ